MTAGAEKMRGRTSAPESINSAMLGPCIRESKRSRRGRPEILHGVAVKPRCSASGNLSRSAQRLDPRARCASSKITTSAEGSGNRSSTNERRYSVSALATWTCALRLISCGKGAAITPCGTPNASSRSWICQTMRTRVARSRTLCPALRAWRVSAQMTCVLPAPVGACTSTRRTPPANAASTSAIAFS